MHVVVHLISKVQNVNPVFLFTTLLFFCVVMSVVTCTAVQIGLDVGRQLFLSYYVALAGFNAVTSIDIKRKVLNKSPQPICFIHFCNSLCLLVIL